jgi:23S rRNA (cytosine1962-C5)-methyltransferase
MNPNHTLLLEQAIAKRASLSRAHPTTNAYRIVHSEADHFPGVTIDKLDKTILVELHRPDIDLAPLLDALCGIFGDRTPIFLKERWSSKTGNCIGGQVRGLPSPSEITIQELGLSFGLNLCDGEHIGLFLDARPVRKTVRGLADGRRVLNLFSYTGAFGVAAGAGGARSTTNIDNKKSALDRARHNYALNGLQTDTRTFLRSDVFKYLARAVKGKARYDVIILDPPPRSKRPGGRWFHASTGYAALAARCLELLAPKGILLAGLNDKKATVAQFTRMLNKATKMAKMETTLFLPIALDPDFPPSTDRPVGQFRLVKSS